MVMRSFSTNAPDTLIQVHPRLGPVVILQETTY